MKTKLTALLLVCVMAATLLCGCTFRYDKKNLGKYAEDYDAAALKTALTNMVLEDEDFTTDEETRKQKTYAGLEETFIEYFDGEEERLTEGAITSRDKLTVRLYVQFNKNNQEDVLADTVYSLETMKADSTISFASTVALQLDVFEALKAMGDSVTYGTVDSSETALKAGDKVFVSYMEKADADAKETTAFFTVPAEDDGTLAGQLIGKTVGTTFASETAEAITISDVQYYKITPQYVVTGEANACKITLADETTLKDAFGNSKTFVKGAPGTAFVYVAERYTVPDVTVEENRETILRTFLKSYDYTDDALTIFSSEDYAYKYTVTEGEGEAATPVEKTITLKQIFDCLISAADEDTEGDATNADLVTAALDAALLKEKKDALTRAQADYDEEKAKEAPDETTLAELKTALDAASDAYSDADLWYDSTVTMILSADKVKEETEKDVVTALFDAFYESKYAELKAEYEDAMYTKVEAAVEKILADTIKVTSAPKSALREAYYNNLDAYRYEYYEGDSAETNQTTYKTVELYLQAKATEYLQGIDKNAAAVTTKKARKAALHQQAEEQVKDLVELYVTAAALNEAFGTDLEVTKDAQLNYASQYLWYYQYLYSYYGYDTSSMTAESILDTLIDESGETNFKASVMDSLIQNFLYEVTENGGALDFKNIHYTTAAKAD